MKLMWRAGFRAARFPLRLASGASKGLGLMALSVRTVAGEFWHRPGDFPVTRFNTVVSPHRVFDTRRFALDDFERISRLVKGASINDVVLAVCAGGLRRYLLLQDELPRESLLAAAPITLHNNAQGANDFSWVRVSLHTHEPDALRRLNAITHPRIAQRSTELIAQAPTGAVVVYDMPLLVEQGPDALTGWDHIAVVDCPDDVRLGRLVARGMDADDARRRMASQATREERIAVADTVIDNSRDLASLTGQVDSLWDRLRGAGA